MPFNLPMPADINSHAEPVLTGSNGYRLANRSLIHDCYLHTWGEGWTLGTGEGEGKSGFHHSFASKFNNGMDQSFGRFIRRRSAALRAAGYLPVSAKLKSRLVLGLGLDHPTELGFMLDRMTGCPYIPASSVKGFLRANAKPAGWSSAAIDASFGPLLGDGNQDAARGKLSFADAFPDKWPELEVDVLTPHYGPYYMPSGNRIPAPGDWFDPVPSTFLTVKKGGVWTFWYRPQRDFHPPSPLPELFAAAFAAQGVGAKKCAGYGWFEIAQNASSVNPSSAAPASANLETFDLAAADEDSIKMLFRKECRDQSSPGSDVELARRIAAERPDVVAVWKEEFDRKTKPESRDKTTFSMLVKRVPSLDPGGL
ncbi:MAG: type III-B CRISPR module RAMP protein Cmr6 [bacterium]|jgi:CRISPR-associated protein Cmr6